jgi:hypothetical protein
VKSNQSSDAIRQGSNPNLVKVMELEVAGGMVAVELDYPACGYTSTVAYLQSNNI